MSENQMEDINNNSNGNIVEPLKDDSKELLDVIFILESEKQALVDESRKRLTVLRKELEESNIENEKLQRKINQLEQSLKQSVMLGGSEAPKSVKEQEDMLLKAKTLLFEKTKVNKQQEQQIETLKLQVEAVKEVVQVTKDMLNLKTAEHEHMEARLVKAQEWIQAERDKCNILEKKLDISKGVYEKLRTEYNLQSNIFKELKETYAQKEQVLTAALARAREP